MDRKWAFLVAGLVGAFAFFVGRWSVAGGLLSRSHPSKPIVASFKGGALGSEEVRDAISGMTDPKQRRAAVEEMVRARLLAKEAEAIGLEETPEFLRRYSEELARAYLEEAFEKPLERKLPGEAEVRRFFDANRTKLARPERARLAHLALFAPRSDGEARSRKRSEAEKLLSEIRRTASDEYAFGRLAMVRSEDPMSRPAAGELPFATREEIEARLGAEAAEAAFSGKPGAIPERVIETEKGFQIVKVLAREEGQEARYDELRDAINARLSADVREKAFKEFVDALWAKGKVKIDEAALAKLAPASAKGGLEAKDMSTRSAK